MISSALALAILTTSGFYVVYSKMPRKMRKLIEKYGLLADVLALIAVYYLLGGTLTALMAGAMCGLFISGLLHIANNREDFLYLYDARDAIRDKLKQAKEALNAYGKVYRENNQPELSEETT